MTGRNKFSTLMEEMTPESRERAARKADELRMAMPLHELRHALSLSQQEIAQVLDVGQASISKLERRTDMYVSTLRRFVEAMGGTLDVIARLPQGEVRITNFGDLRDHPEDGA